MWHLNVRSEPDMTMPGSVTLSVLCLLCLACLTQAQVQVDTIYGTVEGRSMQDENGRSYDLFMGIPFAEPPVGDLRWHKSQPHEPWDDVYMADRPRDMCIQITRSENVTSEDCLHLNVFVPGSVQSAQDLPVMIYYHGGYFILGASYDYPAQKLANHGNVIVVTANYRVSSIGFLSTGDDAAPGNYGLWDVRLALQWVVDNIEFFGGDPDSVTIFGLSAGGAITSHVLISQETNEMFQRGIAISGTASSWFGTANIANMVASTKVLGLVFQCDYTDDDLSDLVNCLKEVDADALDFWSILGVVFFLGELPSWFPVVDGDFLAREPLDLWEDGAAAHLDMIVGHAHDDFAGYCLLNTDGVYSNISEAGGMAMTHESLYDSMMILLGGYGNPAELVDILYDRYPDLLSDDSTVRAQALSEAITDWTFASPAHNEAALHLNHAEDGVKTYAYEYHYRESFFEYPDWVEGSHSDDHYSMWGEGYSYDLRQEHGWEYSEEDYAANLNTMTYYSNFARTGDPNQGNNPTPATWDPYQEGPRNYMAINDAPEMRTLTLEQEERYDWWINVWPGLAEDRDFTNYTGPSLPEGCELPPSFPPNPDCLPDLPDFIPIPPGKAEHFDDMLREAAYGFEKWLMTILPDDSIEEMENLHNMVERAIVKREEFVASRRN